MNIDSITLSSAHSMIMGNKPSKITLEMVGKKQELEKKDVTSLGLFDNSTPNYTTYYPDVTAEDLEPKEEDFIYPTFRMLSEVVVHKNWNPISFQKPGVLKASMQKLVGQTVNVDHETALGNAIGTVMSVEWQEAYTTEAGVEVPAGINAVLKIDGKSNPRIARGVMMDPPSIHSNSVTVNFAWEKSHLNMDNEEFWEKLGTYDEEGKMISRVVSDIKAFQETSLVAHGADSFAKQIRDGKMVNTGMANDNASLSATQKKDMKAFGLDYGDLVSLSSTATPEQLNNNSNNQKESEMKEALIKLAKASGFTFEGEQPDMEGLAAHLESLNSSQETVANLKESNSNLEAEKTSLTNEVTELKGRMENLEPVVAKLHETEKAEAVRLYKLTAGDKATEEMEALIAGSNPEAVKVFLSQYEGEVEEKFQSTCSDCGSNNITKASAASNDNDTNSNDEEDSNDDTSLSDNDIRSKYANQKRGSRVYTEKN